MSPPYWVVLRVNQHPDGTQIYLVGVFYSSREADKAVAKQKKAPAYQDDKDNDFFWEIKAVTPNQEMNIQVW